MLVTLPNIEKITCTLWLSKVTDTESWVFLALATNFQTSGFISWYFSLIFGKIVADKIIFDLRKFYCKISKGLWDILGQIWHEMKKLEKWRTFVASVTHDSSENLRWKNSHIFIIIWQVYHTKFMNGSQCFHREKIWHSLCKNYKFWAKQRS